MHVYTCTHTLAYAREPIYKHIHMYTCHTRTHIRTCTHIHMHRNIYTNTCKWQADPNAMGGLWQYTGHSREFASMVPLYKLYALPPMRPCNCAKFPMAHGNTKDIFRRRYQWEKINSYTIHNHSHIGTYSRHMYFHIHTCINAHSYACIQYMNNVNNFIDLLKKVFECIQRHVQFVQVLFLQLAVFQNMLFEF